MQQIGRGGSDERERIRLGSHLRRCDVVPADLGVRDGCAIGPEQLQHRRVEGADPAQPGREGQRPLAEHVAEMAEQCVVTRRQCGAAP